MRNRANTIYAALDFSRHYIIVIQRPRHFIIIYTTASPRSTLYIRPSRIQYPIIGRRRRRRRRRTRRIFAVTTIINVLVKNTTFSILLLPNRYGGDRATGGGVESNIQRWRTRVIQAPPFSAEIVRAWNIARNEINIAAWGAMTHSEFFPEPNRAGENTATEIIVVVIISPSVIILYTCTKQTMWLLHFARKHRTYTITTRRRRW